MIEKITFKNKQGLNLAGVLHTPENKTDKIIIFVHGFTSHKDRPRYTKGAEEFTKKGYAVFRFDFGACGESEGNKITIKNQVEELNSAIDLMKKKGFKDIALYGHSLGGLDAILCNQEDIKTMILLSPVTTNKDPGLLKQKNYKEEHEKTGKVVFKREGREYLLPKEYFEERNKIKQDKILSKIKCPVLIIHGTEDQSIPLKHSENAMKYLPKGSKLEIIKGGNHNLYEQYDEIIKMSIKWLRVNL